MNLAFTNECIAALLDKGVKSQTKISGDKGIYISIGKSGTAAFFLRWTDPRIGKQGTPILLGAWVPGVYGVGEADIDASIQRNNIKQKKYPSKNLSALAGHGITFPKLVEAYIADISTMVEKPVANRPSATVSEPRLRTWKKLEAYLSKAKARFHDRFAASLTGKDFGALFDSIEAPAASNRTRQACYALCRWANNTTNPATNEPFIEVNWFANFLKPRKKELGIKKRLHDEQIAILWRALREDENCPGTVHARRALALVLATALRPGEVCSLRRRDVIDIDGTDPRLYIKPEMVKKCRYQVQPLNAFAVAIVKEALADADEGDDALLFKSRNGGECTPALLSSAMLGVDAKRIGIMGYLGWLGTENQVGPHALRRTAADLLHADGFGKTLEEIAYLLDHQQADEKHKVTAGYALDFTVNSNKGDRFHAKRVELAQALQERLQAVLNPAPVEPPTAQPTNVVPLRKVA